MRNIVFIVGLLLPFSVSANIINGKVTNSKKEPLVNAYVYWLGSSNAVSTDNDGKFEIPVPENSSRKLIASYVGHIPDTIDITNQDTVAFILLEKKELKEVVVSAQRNGVVISDLKPIKTEQITTTELRKSACCDLAGCFETQSSVQPQTTNIITNSKELRILGLSGVYNQILIDGLPMIQGLTYTYGISSIPGVLVNAIHISKGANSVVQGYESISGQINVETKEPDHADRLLLNVYINSYLEKQVNAYHTFKKGNWSNLTAAYVVQPANRVDKDNDNFLDLPLLTRYSFLNKWKYGDDNKWGFFSTIRVRYLNEQRVGGQYPYNPDNDKGSLAIYGQTVNISQPEVWTKTGYTFNDNHKFSFNAFATHQKQASYFGTVKYNAHQNHMYGNFQYDLGYNQHSLSLGTSFRHVTIDEDIAFTDTTLHRSYDGNYKQAENIPGLFAENTLRLFNDKLTWIAGFRADHHNDEGFIFTPRTLIKWDLAPKTIVRFNIGTGWRTVNIFSENIGLLVSSRNILFTEKLKPEKALNYGINLTQKFATVDENLSGYLSADFYTTEFQNQIFPDYDTDPTLIIIKNFRERSTSNGFQAELNLKLWKLFEWKFGYNYLNVFTEENGQKVTLPFNPKHKFLATFSFKPRSNKFNFDVNLHRFGKQRLPNTSSNPLEFRRPGFSEPYTIVNTQFTYNFKQFEVYTGCENIFNFRQDKPIISWQNPFGPYFDTSSAWGPTRGREFYLGIRLKLN